MLHPLVREMKHRADVVGIVTESRQARRIDGKTFGANMGKDHVG